MDARHPGILPVWWLLWLVAAFIGQAVLRTALGGESIDDYLMSSWLMFFSNGWGRRSPAPSPRPVTIGRAPALLG
ncbi:MAG: hypothetical protein ACOC8B_00405 [Gemmatimonadota bacterium]